MTVQELLMKICDDTFDIEKELGVKKYLPIDVKKAIAQGIIFDCTENVDGAIKIDSVQKHMSYVKHMITMHTNLQYTDEDYDTLCSTEYLGTTLLNVITLTFDKDAKECKRILNLMMDDYMQEMSVDFAVARLLGQLGSAVKGISDTINKKISSVDIDGLKNIDFDVLNKFLTNYIK